ncbi:glycosyltransferase family 4 protein [Lacinutrix sp. Bg11-31]|uniref:glycosyltransferase family 4 protein n=1 Tax=Lacinutrix sp. Bg11-31 TaxID=2057808 RepID=UPI000C30B6A6|nr:glycosyltransferase family 4 protein [Lacinutrix sp. Bg11-31]AUC82056.1 glycosyl transferase family 1 [Lacinutrix sp. Bg11-31]
MKNLLYIGNKLSSKGKTATTIDTLGNALSAEGYSVKAVSNKKNKFFRLLDMLLSILKNKKWADYVLIDTYSTQNFYYAYLTSWLCRLLQLKYLPILHGGNLPNRLKNSPKLSTAIFKNAYINVAPSEYIKSNFESFGYHNIAIIPNAIALDNYIFKQREIEVIRLLWVRSFSEVYNPKLAVSILKALHDIGEGASLTMVGPDNDGSLEDTKAFAESLNVEVDFTGKLSKQEWITRSKDYNIFINTTNFDNMPVSVIEAMALGLPVISTNVGGLPFLIENNLDGLLVPLNNVDAFVAAILKLKNNQEVIEPLIGQARKKVELYNWQIVKEKWKSILE